MQSKLYPTVGLQTPGEVIDANFGQEPFTFDISDMVKELRGKTRESIYDKPLPDGQCDWTVTMHKYDWCFFSYCGGVCVQQIFLLLQTDFHLSRSPWLHIDRRELCAYHQSGFS